MNQLVRDLIIRKMQIQKLLQSHHNAFIQPQAVTVHANEIAIKIGQWEIVVNRKLAKGKNT